MHAACQNLPVVNGHTTPLLTGTYRLTWGQPSRVAEINLHTPCDLVTVVQLDVNTMLLVDLDPDNLNVRGHITWHAGPQEMLTDPLRVLRDPEQDGEGLNKVVTAAGLNAY